MRYFNNLNTENTLKDTVFCHFQENMVINIVKKIMDTATKTGIDAAKTASIRVVQKTAEDLIGNEIADKITSLSKTKNKEKEDEKQELYLPPEKRQQIIDDFKLF